MATALLSGLEGSRLPDLLLLVRQTAERARKSRAIDPRGAMIPEQILEAKVLYARARAWPLGKPQWRAEPKWRRPGDVEAAFFALYEVLRSQIRSALGNHYIV